MTMASTPPASGALRWLDALLQWLALLIGGATLTFMAVLSTVNVLLMRKALNDPIRGAEDLMVLALVVVVAVSIPLGARTGAHIEIELLDPYLPDRLVRGSRVLMKLFATGLLGLLAWQLWTSGGEATRFGEASQQLVISFGPFYRILATSVALYAVVAMSELVLAVAGRTLPLLRVDRDGAS